jgi:hypothetical protein
MPISTRPTPLPQYQIFFSGTGGTGGKGGTLMRKEII